ncbi:MAG: SpoIID/LytB domain-containing protein, partial [Bifidobacteriaceae bacterium]|nr:SpoIID/LytB domain-containing protein [Bifidobacteriaceae bacterium]
GFYYPGTTIANRAVGSIRVQLIQSASVVVRFAGAAGTLSAGGSATAAAKGAVVAFTVSGGQVKASGVGADRTAASFALAWNGASNCTGYVTVDNAAAGSSGYCRGTMTATVIGGKVNLIATLGLARDYIYGLGEVPSSWQAAALQAQACAARTYAAKQTLKDSCNCEVYSDTRSQAYVGRSKEVEATWGAKWVAAVNATSPSATSGSLVLYGGSPITASYSAANGGASEASAEIWSSALPYLISKADPWSVAAGVPDSVKAWTATKTQAQMRAIFGLADVASATITATTQGGSAKTIVAKSSAGASKTISGAEAIRAAFGLKSAHFKISGGQAAAPISPVSPFAQVLLSADVTGDGRGEVVGLDAAGRVWTYPALAGPKLGGRVLTGAGFGGYRLFAPGDWSGDGRGDLAGIDANGDLWRWAGAGGGKLSGAPARLGNGWTTFQAIPAGDLTGDGLPDLLGIDAQGLLYLYAWRGASFAMKKQVGNGWTGWQLLAAGDLNGDGRGDILGIDPAGDLYCYHGRGNGRFAMKIKCGNGWNTFQLAAGADLTGDHLADIVGLDQATRNLYLYQGRGNGRFRAKQQIGNGW